MRFTREQQDEMVQRYKQGSSQTEIGRQMGVHGATVGKVLRRLGVQCRNTPSPVTESERDTIRRLYIDGLGTREIGRRLGRPYQTVYGVVRSMGIARSPGDGRRSRVSQEIRDQAVLLYQIGKTLTEIESELTITRTIVYRELKDRGIKRRRAGSRGRFHNQPEKRKKLAEAYARGCSQSLLAEVFKCSRGVIKKILKEHNIDPRKEIPGQQGYQFIDRKGREHWMRSSWEIKTAKWLDLQDKDWDYEKETYEVGPRKRYTPDFWIYDSSGTLELVVDVKGWLYEDSAERISLFQEQHPNLPLEIWSQDYLEDKGVLAIEIDLPLEVKNYGLRSRISKGEIQKAVELYESGMTTGQVAEALNRSESAIARQLQKLGKTRNRHKTKRMLSADQDTRDKIAEVYSAGNSVTKTAELVGVGRDVVYGELRRRGLTRPRRGRKPST